MMGSAKKDYGWIGKATVELTRAERSSGGCGALRRFGHVFSGAKRGRRAGFVKLS